MLHSSLKFLAVFALAGAFALPAFAYVSPGTPTGYVNDFAGVISAETKAELESVLTQFHTDTGGDIAVAVVSSLEGDDIETYSNTLFREWGVGGADKDKGILLVVAVEDRKVRIEVGYGYEGDVPDAYSSRIINETITPRFKEEDYDGGITNGVSSLITLIRDPDYVPPLEEESSFSFEDFGVIGYIFFGFIAWLGSVLVRSKSWWGGGIVGGVIAVIVGIFGGTTLALVSALPLIGLGLLFDFAVSSAYKEAKARGHTPPWWIGGGGFGGGSHGGGFGGFGGGSSGGGGASGRW